MTRNTAYTLVLTAIAAAVAMGAMFTPSPVASEAGPTVLVYKSPVCPCCEQWIDHMKAAGFEMEVHIEEDMASVKKEFGVPQAGWSCHTAVVDGRVLEGHVPADLVESMLAETSDIIGLVVPGMPLGSPGMPDRPGRPAYDILTLHDDGTMTPRYQR